jgi:hypothetical protein
MVPSSTLAFSADGENLTCGGFSLVKTILLGRFEFIDNYFSGLILSFRRSDSGTTFVGSTHNGPPSPRLTLIEDSTEEFHITSSGGGGSGLPSHRRFHHIPTVAGGRFGYLVYDDVSTMGVVTAAAHRPLL